DVDPILEADGGQRDGDHGDAEDPRARSRTAAPEAQRRVPERRQHVSTALLIVMFCHCRFQLRPPCFGSEQSENPNMQAHKVHTGCTNESAPDAAPSGGRFSSRRVDEALLLPSTIVHAQTPYTRRARNFASEQIFTR